MSKFPTIWMTVVSERGIVAMHLLGAHPLLHITPPSRRPIPAPTGNTEMSVQPVLVARDGRCHAGGALGEATCFT